MTDGTDARISVTVNGEERTVPDGYSLVAVLRDIDINPDEQSGVAVALNESVLRRQDWDDVTLSEDDTLEIIRAQQGG